MEGSLRYRSTASLVLAPPAPRSLDCLARVTFDPPAFESPIILARVRGSSTADTVADARGPPSCWKNIRFPQADKNPPRSNSASRSATTLPYLEFTRQTL